MPFLEPPLIARRNLDGLLELTLGSPELANAARPGQYVLVQSALPGSHDPLLPQPIFFVAADPAAGTVRLLVSADDPAVAYLAERQLGARIALFGPLGTPFAIEPTTRQLLLAGYGPALPALLFLAAQSVARRIAVVLLVAGPAAQLPPPVLLPPDVEYQRSAGPTEGLLDLLGAPVRPGGIPFDAPLVWADQCCVAVAEPLLAPLIAAVRAARLRWTRGFAQVILAGAMPCGVGACQCCLIATRAGLRTRCKDGPVFDLRDLQG
ncbi:MAG: hypothetical protein HC822_09170 [Oscillochloris sp.]|nr:hypothetical protein [Oscillochloris sp.]